MQTAIVSPTIQTNSLYGGMVFRIASSQDSFPVMGFCVYPRFSNNLSNKRPKSTQNFSIHIKTHQHEKTPPIPCSTRDWGVLLGMNGYTVNASTAFW